MMDWTDRHCRFFHRLLSRRTRLYTEMVTTGAVIHGPRRRLLGFSEAEHPVAVQLGGADPRELAAAARISADLGYDEINLNVGCPSDRVQNGRFGACLMREPGLVGDCVAAMKAAVAVPVTVKCRIGVDEQDPEEALDRMAEAAAAAGTDALIVHARKAWLHGLSPKENRDVPPLDYGRVYRLKAARPGLPIVINGGIGSLAEAENHLAHVDGVMLGRTAYEDPAILLEVDRRFFGEVPPAASSLRGDRGVRALSRSAPRGGRAAAWDDAACPRALRRPAGRAAVPAPSRRGSWRARRRARGAARGRPPRPPRRRLRRGRLTDPRSDPGQDRQPEAGRQDEQENPEGALQLRRGEAVRNGDAERRRQRRDRRHDQGREQRDVADRA